MWRWASVLYSERQYPTIRKDVEELQGKVSHVRLLVEQRHEVLTFSIQYQSNLFIWDIYPIPQMQDLVHNIEAFVGLYYKGDTNILPEYPYMTHRSS